MPGQTPLRNAVFTSAPDFNNQAVSGITGAGVFRTFGTTSRFNNIVLESSDLWKILTFSGNSVVEIPQNITSTIGDEIILVNASGTISFVAGSGVTLLSSIYYATPTERPARLIYAGSNTWILGGDKDSYTLSEVYDCCSNVLAPLYTFGPLAEGQMVYSDTYGMAIYTVDASSNIVVINGTDYTIAGSIVSPGSCVTVDFDVSYTFYSAIGDVVTLYSYLTFDILNDAEIIGKPFKTSATYGVFPCDVTNAANFTYYRASSMYGVELPVCIIDGIVNSLNVCA